MTDQPPLRDRIAVSSEPVLPVAPVSVVWRRMADGELGAVHEFLLEIDRVDRPEALTPFGELKALLGPDRVDPLIDTVVAEQDGRVVAIGAVSMAPEWNEWVTVRLPGGVHPSVRGRGVGRELLGWQLHRADQRLAALDVRLPGRIVTDIECDVADAEHLARRAGLASERVFVHMRRGLDARPPAREPSWGMRVDRFAAELDEPLRVAKNAVFADHWRAQPDSPASWAQRHLGPHLRRDLSRVAVTDDGRIAGFVVTWFDPDRVDPPREAYIELVGVAAEFRGRGIAKALLIDVMRACAHAGLATVALDVDGESLTGADRLYRAVGFDAVSRTGVWAVGR